MSTENSIKSEPHHIQAMPEGCLLLSVPQYAARHAVHRNTVINWLRSDSMLDDVVKAYKLPGGRWRIVVIDVAA